MFRPHRPHPTTATEGASTLALNRVASSNAAWPTRATRPVGLRASDRQRFRAIRNLPTVDATVWVFAAVAAVSRSRSRRERSGARRTGSTRSRRGRCTNLDEAVDFVADRLPPESQARLTPAEVEALLVAHLHWLHEQGLQPDKAVDHRQDISEQVVISEDALVAYLLGAADEAGVELLDDVDAVNVVDAHLAYSSTRSARLVRRHRSTTYRDRRWLRAAQHSITTPCGVT